VSKFSFVAGKDLISALMRAVFLLQRSKGSHDFLRHLDGRTTIVPGHSGESIGPDLLAKDLRDVDLIRNEPDELLS
jgi:predicted RNA binding protein YcfA (HicA-like mRNA interferase family)